MDEFADADLVDRSKRILRNDVQVFVKRQEGTGVVAAHAEGCLCEVVCSEAEEFGSLGDFIGT